MLPKGHDLLSMECHTFVTKVDCILNIVIFLDPRKGTNQFNKVLHWHPKYPPLEDIAAPNACLIEKPFSFEKHQRIDPPDPAKDFPNDEDRS
ncbi:MAG: hypothetical protein M1829_000648 [Trizodia sp. TS-e1964]|nr:MAG: hypothetical protein M1829_000648 [Trizodia sp. TS-e1964]